MHRTEHADNLFGNTFSISTDVVSIFFLFLTLAVCFVLLRAVGNLLLQILIVIAATGFLLWLFDFDAPFLAWLNNTAIYLWNVITGLIAKIFN